MKEKDLKRLSRADLLEMLIEQSQEVQKLRERLDAAEAELKKREIAISNAGSIAEASLMLNGVFEAAQAACREYVENTHKYCERREPVSACHYEPARAVQSEPILSSGDYRGMPYAQYVMQAASQPVFAARSDTPPSSVQHRTARYLGVVDSKDPGNGIY